MGLLWAFAFSVSLNLAVAASSVWSETVATAVNWLLWALVGGWWAFAAWNNFATLRETNATGIAADNEPDLFLRAQTEYLCGHWFEAELILKQCLEAELHDTEARLMLATLFRHTRRLHEASQQLLLLERQDVADNWRPEIEHEQQLVKSLIEEADAEESSKLAEDLSQAA